jgi:hypothetical protein
VGLSEGDPGLLEPAAEIDQPTRREDVLEREVVVLGPVLAGVLAQVAHRPATKHRAARGLVLTGEHLHRAGLAGAVAPHDADLVARAQVEREPVDDDLAPHLDDEVTSFERDHRGTPKRCGLLWAADIRNSLRVT